MVGPAGSLLGPAGSLLGPCWVLLGPAGSCWVLAGSLLGHPFSNNGQWYTRGVQFGVSTFEKYKQVVPKSEYPWSKMTKIDPLFPSRERYAVLSMSI